MVGALEALKEAYTRGDRGVQAKALEEFARQRKAQELEGALTSHQQTRSEGSWEWVWTQALWLAVDLLWRAEVHLPTLPLLPQGSLPGERRRALEAPRALEELAQALGGEPPRPGQGGSGPPGRSAGTGGKGPAPPPREGLRESRKGFLPPRKPPRFFSWG